MYQTEIEKREETKKLAFEAGFKIDCTGDACTGDFVFFRRSTFTGSFRSPKFSGYETIVGQIISDSYGSDRGQHTFTILIKGVHFDQKLLIKGRNLYGMGTFRKKWTKKQGGEDGRQIVLDEKHDRGGVVRRAKARQIRGESLDFYCDE